MRPPTVDLDDDQHPDEHNATDQMYNCRNTQHPARSGAWGDNISSLSGGHFRFVFQNVNELFMSTGIHDALKSKMVELQGTVTALAETNVSWKNFTFCDNWETLLQHSYSTLHFSHSSCDNGHHSPMQRGGTSMICNHCLGAKLVDKGWDNPMGCWSWIKLWGKGGTKVLVISANQVSQTSARGLGMETVYMQNWQKLAKIRAKVNPRAQFWEDLTLSLAKSLPLKRKPS